MTTQGWIIKIGTTVGIIITLTMLSHPASATNWEAERLRIKILNDREVKAINQSESFMKALVACQVKVSMIKSPDEVRRQSRIVLKSIQDTIDLYLHEIDLMADLLNSADKDYYLLGIKHRQAFIEMLEEEKTKWQGFIQKGKADYPEWLRH